MTTFKKESSRWKAPNLSALRGAEAPLSDSDHLRCLRHEVVVEKALPLGEAAAHHVLVLLGHLLLHVDLDPAQQEGPQHLVQPLDKALVVLLAALDHPRQRVGEPLLELPVGLEHVGHEEVHQRPQLHQAVLQGRPRQQQSPVAAAAEETRTG